MTSASKSVLSLNNVKILRPKVKKNLKNLPRSFVTMKCKGNFARRGKNDKIEFFRHFAREAKHFSQVDETQK